MPDWLDEVPPSPHPAVSAMDREKKAKEAIGESRMEPGYAPFRARGGSFWTSHAPRARRYWTVLVAKTGQLGW